ncbi:MAG: T9SS type A sorting domain-containing protein [Saprospirales bacterium]|nr:T9SS type A sorting domain-containing protein [Saprospirales bacterium]
MKKHLILVSLIFTAALPAIFGQTLQVGMRLEYYRYSYPFIPPNFFIYTISLSIAADTVIQGTSWLKVQSEPEENCFYDYDPVLIREEGSRVYHFTEGESRLLFDYALNPGDTLWQSYKCWNPDTDMHELCTFSLVIGDTLSVWAGGAWRKMQSIDWAATPPPWLEMCDDILEGFGSTLYFFPRYGLCEPNMCLHAIYWPNGDVEVVDSLVNCIFNSVQEPPTGLELEVNPNPVQDVMYLHASQPLPPDSEVTVYDLHGRPVYRGAFAEAEKGISVISWPAGVYVAEIWDGGRSLAARVVVF